MGRAIVRTRTMYTGLAAFAMAVSGAAGILAVAGLLLAQAGSAGAAALCAAVFFVPGLAFYHYARKLQLRNAALVHVAGLAREAGVIGTDRIAGVLGVRVEDAEKIVRRAIGEGHLKGKLDARRRFVAEDAPRCEACGEPVPRDAAAGACPRCGGALRG